ncbi:GTP 3',8-cyclase MoaA [Paenibacillus mesotrionivorans]|uniref:GTP 3',8-cyclase MoaA n=1 Tax=Paenibacillus mesotrionivorans TaxID=3160968 RepID=A0ACC7NT53_9BACL
MEEQLTDKHGRKHDYIRISVTDRCNLRCVYCMPEEGVEFEPEENILQAEEIREVVRVLAGMGIRKLRLTGGEPLLRKDLPELVAMLAAVPGIEDIGLTTNGIFLEKKAEALKLAGLTRINISLDSLREDRFRLITRGGDIRKVLASVDAALRAGLDPVKLNVVLVKGVNDDEIADFLKLTLDRKLNVRFIEYMPIGHSGKDWKSGYLPLEEVLRQAEALGLAVEPAGGITGNGPAENYRLQGAEGTFGLIHPVSDHFCQACNRLRLTADGYIKPCLYWSDEFHVRSSIGDDEALRILIRKALATKPENHEMALAMSDTGASHTPTVRRMSQIGG